MGVNRACRTRIVSIVDMKVFVHGIVARWSVAVRLVVIMVAMLRDRAAVIVRAARLKHGVGASRSSRMGVTESL